MSPPPNAKIKSVDKLAEWLAVVRSEKRTLVLCHGAFELLHPGIIRHLERAKKLGDLLVVTVASDTPSNVAKKGMSYPLFNQDLRAEALSALSCVDLVVTNHAFNAIEAIQAVQPAVYVPSDLDSSVNDDNSQLRQAEEAMCRSWGGRVVRLADNSFHSARLLCHDLPTIPYEARQFLASFSARYRPDEVLGTLERARGVRALFIGETIIDEYHYCETMGKSGKEPVLAVRHLSEERFAGGILATANQAATISDHVGMLTLLGNQESFEGFIREKLNPNIDAIFVYMPGTRTIVKRRIVESYPLQKLFEIYYMDINVPESASNALYARLKTLLPQYDVVVATDYGHGLFTPEIIELLCKESRFLAVNTQTNAANQGFNTIAKYPRADFVGLSEKELRLEARNRSKDLRLLVSEASERMSCDRMLITRGRDGSLAYQRGQGFFAIPPVATRIVDRVGAGDALLAVSALCASQKDPMEVVGFIGNVVGARAVEMVGNRSVVLRNELLEQINSLLNYGLGT